MMRVFEFIKRKKWLIIIIAGVLIGGLFLKQTLAKKSESQYETVKAEKSDIVSSVNASGEITGEEKITLRFHTSGYLSWVGVKEGDYVQKWQSIASLDRKQLEKSLKQELIDYENERYDMDEERKSNNISSNNFDGFSMSDNVKYDLLRSQNTLNRTVLDVELTDIALKYSTLVTPIEGIITVVNTPYAGIHITPANAEFEIVNPNSLIFEAKVDEVDVVKLTAGMKAILTLDAYPDEELSAKVMSIGFTPTTSAGGGTAYIAKVNLPLDKNLRLGMNGDIDIIIKEVKDVLTVPFESVKQEDQEYFVYILTDGNPEKKTVTIGETDDINTQILSGINDGDEIIVSGIKLNLSQ